MAAAVGVLWAGLYVGMSALMAVLFGAIVGLVGIVIVMALVVAVLATIIKAATGSRRVGAAIAVTLFAGVAQAAALAHFGQIPMMWVQPGLDLVYPVVALFGAVALGLFLGPWWVRAAGAVAALAMVVGVGAVLRPEHPVNDLNRVRSEEEQFADFSALNSETLVSDAPGFEAVLVQRNDGYTAWERTPGGGVVQISFLSELWGDQGEPSYQCWILVGWGSGLESTDPVEDYAPWCVADGDGWARSDGLGLSRLRDGGFVYVLSSESYDVPLAQGSRRATAEEVALALATLRPITEDEMRVAFQNSIPTEPERSK